MTPSRVDILRSMVTPSRIVFLLLLPVVIFVDQQGLLSFPVVLSLWICVFILGVYFWRRESHTRKTRHSSN